MVSDAGCVAGCGAAVAVALTAFALMKARCSRFLQFSRTKTVYLLRHGEAVHNVAEKSAKRKSVKMLATLEIHAGSETFEDIVEGARVEVLRSDSFHDAPLSTMGEGEAKEALAVVLDLQNKGFPPPTAIFVSPLQRALKTAAIVFPRHPKMHVNEHLRERKTGLPCDESSPVKNMMKRLSFQGMVWDLVKDASGEETKNRKVEDKKTLNGRAHGALEEILACKDKSIGIVSHKGFLRELERGALGHPHAVEFSNCEVRVYDVTLQAEGDIVATCRYNSQQPDVSHPKTV